MPARSPRAGASIKPERRPTPTACPPRSCAPASPPSRTTRTWIRTRRRRPAAWARQSPERRHSGARASAWPADYSSSRGTTNSLSRASPGATSAQRATSALSAASAPAGTFTSARSRSLPGAARTATRPSGRGCVQRASPRQLPREGSPDAGEQCFGRGCVEGDPRTTLRARRGREALAAASAARELHWNRRLAAG